MLDSTPKPPPATGTAPRIGLVSLGCAKALYDTEQIVTHLRAEGYEFSADYAGADLVLINTCGFLDSARAESFEAIGEAMAENGKVIVTGCLGADPAVIEERFPHVLAVTGPAQYEKVIGAVHRVRPPRHDPHVDLVPPGGIKLTPRHYAYLKISEGCNNRCSFCIIPGLRGRLASRPAADILSEAERLVTAGVQELLVISQDTPAYGVDLRHGESRWHDRSVTASITDLARELGRLGVWVRLHYVYPYGHVDRLVELMADGAILPYLDVPFQHAAPSVLKAMRRPADQARTLEKIARWRSIAPDLALRSTFIVGFPGESEEDFTFLLDWLAAAQIDRVGCFMYENVTGAAAQTLPDQVPEPVKQDRYRRLMAHQEKISAAKLARKIETVETVMIDRAEADGAIGRTRGDAPDVDGIVHVAVPPGGPALRPGMRVPVRITDADPVDLWGRLIDG